MNIDEIYTNLKQKQIYPVNSVKKGYSYYVELLTEKANGMYIYSGLPDSLPSDQIELKLVLDGFCVVFNHPKFGLVTSGGGLSGIDKYYLPTNFVYAQPALGSGNLIIDKNCVVIYNSSIDQYTRSGLSEIIQRSARLLADIDSSISILTINTRATKLNVAANDSIAKTVNHAMQKIADGEIETINTQSLLDLYKTVDWNSEQKQQEIIELLNAKQQIMASFLSEIGVKNFTEKKERLITDEVTADNQLLTINVEDMEDYRKKGIKEVNKMFGTSITVKRNPSYNVNSYSENKESDKNADEELSDK